MINIAESDGEPSTLGVMGAYELNLDLQGMVGELTSLRIPSIGESYIVNGMTFFTISPCQDCLKIRGIEADPPYAKLIFRISHPFEKGDTGKPPSALNRLDLDIFDLALVVVQTDQTPVNYSLAGASIYPDICGNADGYTRELEKVIGSPAACPYFLVVDDSETETPTNNRFAMGTKNLEFGAWFKGGHFNLYLTMGYGASAKRPQRLNPIYYLPEFNRKAAWKVVVEPPASWSDRDSTTANNVIVKVYDWQSGATVDPTLNDPTDIYASSNVAGVGVEIPGMFDELKVVSSPTGTHDGSPTDPLIYTIPIANEKLLPGGAYTGLVKVLDERTPPQNPTTGQIDSLVDAQHDGNGTSLYYRSMPEFATYQLFTSNVVDSSNNPPVWDTTIGIQSATPGNTTITVTFGTATDPDGDNPVTYDLYYVDETNSGNSDPFNSPNSIKPNVTSPYQLSGLTNYHTYWLGVRAKDSRGLSETNTIKKSAMPKLGGGELLWAKRAGGVDSADQGNAITVLSDNSTVVTGYFEGSATFGLGEINETVLTAGYSLDLFIAKYDPDGTLAWAKQALGIINSTTGNAITTLSDDSTVVTGEFDGSATFGLGDPNEIVLTAGGLFIARYNSNGTLAWAKQTLAPGWSGSPHSYAITTLSDDSTVVTGFLYGTATFGPSEPNQTVLNSAGWYDIFIARYNPDGTLAWAKRAGGAGSDVGYGITTLSDNSTVVTGWFEGSATFGPSEPNQTVLTSAGGDDMFIARYNPNGTLAWAKRAGGALGWDEGYGITTLSDNSTVVTGNFDDSATFGLGEPNETVLISTSYFSDIFIARYNPDGTLAWAKQAGGEDQEFSNGITALSDNSTVVTGYFGYPDGKSATFGEGESNETVLTSAGENDIFIARYNPNGTLAWAKNAGGSSWEEGWGITTLSDNSTVVTGDFWSSSATFGQGETNETVLTSDGGSDIFIARFAP